MKRRDSIDNLRRKTALLLFLKRAALLAAVWGLIWGTAVILLRAAFGQPRPSIWWGIAGLAAALLVAGYWARRQLPSKSAFRAAIDRRSKMGGLLMAEESVDLGAWAYQMPKAQPTKLQWRSGKSSLRLLGAALFVLTSLLIPQRYVDATRARPLDISAETGQLSKGIDALKEERIEIEKVEELENELDRLEEEATGEDPAKTWEALDHVEKELKQTAEEAAEEALTQTEDLANAESLAESLLHESGMMDESLLAESMSALSEMVGKAAQENEQLADALSKNLEDALNNPALSNALTEALEKALNDPSLADALSKAMEGAGDKSALADALSKAMKGALNNPETANALSKALQNALSNPETANALNKALEGALNNPSLMNAMKNIMNQNAAQSNEQNGLNKEQCEALANALCKSMSQNGAKSLSAEQLAKLAEALREAKGKLSERLAKLNEAGLIPMDSLQKCEQLGQCNSAGLAKFLSECRSSGNSGSIQSLMAGMQNQGPGQYGINRGPGAAPLTWKDPASEENAKFNAETLPLSKIASPDSGETLQISSSAPMVNDEAPERSVNVLSGSKAGGGSSHKHQLLPRHKNAVKRYFARGER